MNNINQLEERIKFWEYKINAYLRGIEIQKSSVKDFKKRLKELEKELEQAIKQNEKNEPSNN